MNRRGFFCLMAGAPAGLVAPAVELAAGGLATSNRAFVVGEQPPETVIPLRVVIRKEIDRYLEADGSRLFSAKYGLRPVSIRR